MCRFRPAVRRRTSGLPIASESSQRRELAEAASPPHASTKVPTGKRIKPKWEPTPMAVITSAGSTPSERLLTKLCDQTFLGYWRYANTYRNQGGPKELCFSRFRRYEARLVALVSQRDARFRPPSPGSRALAARQASHITPRVTSGFWLAVPNALVGRRSLSCFIRPGTRSAKP